MLCVQSDDTDNPELEALLDCDARDAAVLEVTACCASSLKCSLIPQCMCAEESDEYDFQDDEDDQSQALPPLTHNATLERKDTSIERKHSMVFISCV